MEGIDYMPGTVLSALYVTYLILSHFCRWDPLFYSVLYRNNFINTETDVRWDQTFGPKSQRQWKGVVFELNHKNSRSKFFTLQPTIQSFCTNKYWKKAEDEKLKWPLFLWPTRVNDTTHYFVGSLLCESLDMGEMQFRVRNDW